jgi:hypothetical protein
LFVVYPSDIVFYIVPKRGFASEDEALHYLSLLSSKVNNGFVLDQPQRGFAVIPTAPAEVTAAQEPLPGR